MRYIRSEQIKQDQPPNACTILKIAVDDTYALHPVSLYELCM